MGQWWFQILEPLHLPSLRACYISSIEKARQIGRWHVWRGWWRGLLCQSWSGSTCHMAGSETSWPNKSNWKPQISQRGLEDLIQGQIIASDLIMIKMIIMIIATWRSWHKAHCRWRSQQKTNRGANEPYDPRSSGDHDHDNDQNHAAHDGRDAHDDNGCNNDKDHHSPWSYCWPTGCLKSPRQSRPTQSGLARLTLHCSANKKQVLLLHPPI